MDTMAETYVEPMKELFAEFASTEVCDTWADSFDVQSTEGNRVVVTYYGSRRLKAFKKACKKTLKLCVRSLYGDKAKLKIVKGKKHQRAENKGGKKVRAAKFFALGIVFVCIAAGFVAVLCNYIGNRTFRETFYLTSSIKVDGRVRVVQLSDLHAASYGDNNALLIERVRALKPDIILCTGDIVDSVKTDTDFAVKLGGELAKIATTCYVYGNNEVEGIYDVPLNEAALDKKFGFTKETRDETALQKLPDAFEQQLESVGVKVLKNEKTTVELASVSVDVFGVLTSNPSSFWSYADKSYADYLYTDTDHLKIMAVHEPFIFEEFQPEYWSDLMVCGHTHGGIVRVPVLGPLYTHEGGLLPERGGDFVYGRYDAAGSPLIVSSGLDNSDVYRLNNQPELVVIDINKF